MRQRGSSPHGSGTSIATLQPMTTRRNFVIEMASFTAALCASCGRSEPTPVPVTSSAPLEKPKPNDSFVKRPLGRTGIELAALGVGGAHLGQTKTADEAIRIVRMALDS